MGYWIAIFIPIVFTIFLLVFFKKHIVWWELTLLIAPSALLIILLHFVMIKYTTSDTEYLGSYVKNAIYYEEWNERVPCRHPIYCTRSCGKNCVTTYVCGHVHAYDVDFHPRHWTKRDNNGQEYEISLSEFNSLNARFSTKPYFVELNRDYHTIDGDAYYTDWNKRADCSDNLTNENSYENKVRASHSIFKFEDISEKDKALWKLYDYPVVSSNKQPVVLGMSVNEITERKLQHLNGYFGSSSQFRTYILFFKNQSIESAFKQRSYWEGGNKNEFVICVGIDSLSRKHQWVKCFSWMDKPDLEVRVQNWFNEIPKNSPVNLNDFANWMPEQIDKHWKRKSFKDFDYLEIELTTTQFTWLMILVALYNVGISIWVVKNDFTS